MVHLGRETRWHGLPFPKGESTMTPRISRWVWVLVLSLGTSLLIPTAPAVAESAGPASPVVANLVNVTIGREVGTPGPGFWGVSLDGGNPNPDNPTLLGYLNATPFTVLRYGAAWADEENWTVPPPGCFHNGAARCWNATNDVVGFADLCRSEARYYCILGVPAEINSVATLAYLVLWLQNETGWRPNCWAIGNEPQVWTHFNLPWSSWSPEDSSLATAAQFAQVVRNYTATLRSIDGPATCIIGLESDSVPSEIGSWTAAVAAAAPNVTSVAMHQYPDFRCNGQSTAQILGLHNLTATERAYNEAVANASGIPVQVHEFNLGDGPSPSACQPFIQGSVGAVFASAVVAQALAGDVPELTYFHFDCATQDCLVSNTTGVATRTYDLYSQLLGQMELNKTWNVTLSGGGAGTYAVLGGDGAESRTLLVSNARPATGLNLSEPSFVPPGWDIQTYYQAPNASVAVSSVTTNATTFAVAPESTLLVHYWNHGGERFTETGLPPGVGWNVNVSGDPSRSASGTAGVDGSLFLSLPNGTYSLSVASDNSSWAPSYPPSFSVNTTVGNVSVAFTLVAYNVTFRETGLPSGLTWSVELDGTSRAIATDGGSDALDFPAEPNGSYAYSAEGPAGWTTSGSTSNGTLVVRGGNSEVNLTYVPVTYGVSLQESGLPAGLAWSATVDGATESLETNGSVDALSFGARPNGTYPYSVATVPGWTEGTLPLYGNLTVAGGVWTQTLEYAPPSYPIRFQESGLPAALAWSVTFDGVTKAATTDGGTDALKFAPAPNGSYPYVIGSVPGWHQRSLPYTGVRVVAGAAVSVALAFKEVLYAVTLREKGLPEGTSWSAVIAGISQSTTGTSMSVRLPNGTFSYTVGNVANYSRTPQGSLVVAGGPVGHTVTFSLVKYAVTFRESGLPYGTAWTVDVGGTLSSSTKAKLTVHLANGTHPYTVETVAGYTPPPPGSLTVEGLPLSVTVTFSAGAAPGDWGSAAAWPSPVSAKPASSTVASPSPRSRTTPGGRTEGPETYTSPAIPASRHP
jgi:hypothetical protein